MSGPRRKYGNLKPAPIDGFQFDSLREMRRYVLDLKPRLAAGEIEELRVHPEYMVIEGFWDFSGRQQRPIIYEADFEYWDKALRKRVIEDVKGFKTKDYMIKRKLFLRILQPDQIFKEISNATKKRKKRAVYIGGSSPMLGA